MNYSKGRGRIYTFTIIHRATSASIPLPYVVGIIELEDGLKVDANIVLKDKLRIGQPVILTFDEFDGNVRPKFIAE